MFQMLLPLKPINQKQVIDGMALVNKIPMNRDIKTCYDFKVSFSNRLIQDGKGYSEVHLVFDRYVNSSLKEQCKEKCSSTFASLHRSGRFLF